MADHTSASGQSVYPLPPGESNYEASGYRYEDAPPPPSQGQIPQSLSQPQAYKYEDNQPVDQAQQTPSSTTKNKNGAEVKPRLRKACDSCSVRKVKCDESGPPCKSCAALEIPCTFNRPSRRRGPPNKHAEAIKRRRLEDGSYNPMLPPQMAASPTRDAAYGLAALSAPASTMLSAEAICDLAVLNTLIDDYFLYIHPLIPLPHEPTFRQQWGRREDKSDKSFLALLAGMIEALVTSFPRRVKQIFASPTDRQQFPHASALVSRCQYVFSEARGKGFLDREEHNLYDACSSYLAGISSAYVFDLRRWRLYCSECVSILRTLNYHKADENAQAVLGMDQPRKNYIEQEIGRRLFWLCFVGAMTMRQLGNSDSDIIMPNAHSDALPPMPLEVDDKYIQAHAIYGQPSGELSELVGFNYNIKIYRAFHALTAIEMAVGLDVLFDWDRQRTAIRNALRDVKAITKHAPPELRLEPKQHLGEWPPRHALNDLTAYSHLLNGRRDSSVDAVGLLPHDDPRRSSPYPKRTVMFEVQKANIYGTQLATRSYLVERYWNLYEIHEQQKNASTSPRATHNVQGSPTVSFLASGFENRFQTPRSAHTPSESMGVDEGEQQMALEREDIVRDMARLLKSINQVNMEPNGHSLCHKIRQVASTLLSQDRTLMARMPTLDNDEVQEYLRSFITILTKLERIGTTLMRGEDPGPTSSGYAPAPPGPGAIGTSGSMAARPSQNSSTNNNSAQAAEYAARTTLAGIAQYASNAMAGDLNGKSQEQIEEEELIQWAGLRELQEKFVMKHEGYLAL